MKKNKTKPAAKSPAPATKAALASKTSAKRAVAPAAKATVKSAVKRKAAAPKVKPVATKAVVTSITAQIDIGFGHALYLRGEGAGLSWDRGLLMNCVSDSQWQLTLGESVRPIVFKFLVDDLSWSAGEDYSVTPGSSVTLVPTF